ncbi:MAG TPA: hypothetical protein VFP73_16615, partial [Terrabacter sp.]|nr:hypothetical protein [Terrabacter sp.]
CTFADRCPAASERCSTSAPPFAALPDALQNALPDAPSEGSGAGPCTTEHRVACWHPRGDAARPTRQESR